MFRTRPWLLPRRQRQFTRLEPSPASASLGIHPPAASRRVLFVSVSAEDEGFPNAGIAPALPPGVQPGDVLLAVGWMDLSAAPNETLSMPGEWTVISAPAASQKWLGVWWHRYSGLAPSTTMTRSVNSAAGTVIGGILAFRGSSYGSPFTIGATSGGTDDTIEHAEISVPARGSVLIAVNGHGNNVSTSVMPSGFTAAFEDSLGGTQGRFQTDAGGAASVACHYKELVQAGFSGTPVETVAAGAGGIWASILLSVRP